MALGVYGKHPAKGDFIDYGLPPAVLKPLEAWLDGVLAEAKTGLGPAWESVWASGPVLHFWLGEAIWGTPVAGALVPSRDRVGRRFPLVLLACGADAPPPPAVSGAGQAWQSALAAHLKACLARSVLDQAAELVADAPWPEAGEGLAAPLPGDFWAQRPGETVAALWDEVALADHRRAAAGRSYWWTEGEVEPAAPQGDPSPEPLAETEPDAPPPDEPPQADEEGIMAAADEDVWALPDPPPDEGSPFDAAPGGLGLFAAPEPATAAAGGGAGAEAPAPPPRPAPRQHPSRLAQIWAGTGLPPGAVLAWFFRGHVGNG